MKHVRVSQTTVAAEVVAVVARSSVDVETRSEAAAQEQTAARAWLPNHVTNASRVLEILEHEMLKSPIID